MDIYRIRWKVESMFKVWKSLASLHVIGKMKMVRFETLLMAKLIYLLINRRIFFAIDPWVYQLNKERKCSIRKFYRQGYQYQLAIAGGALVRYEL